MQYDLIIRNGTVIDGSGLPRFRADVGVSQGKVASIGRIRESAREVIDAEGHIVAPGFIDAHTHMDAQVFWDPIGTCSCWHGITSVVMGNCGFSLAPCAEKDKLRVMRNLERAEDISPEAMEAGIKWSWTTFPEYLDAVDRQPKGINYAAYMGHSALRTYVMGERAFEEEATSEDLVLMKTEMRRAIGAGAIGFTTSRTRNHQTPDGHPVASRLANWNEVRELVGVMGEMNAGIFEIAGEDTGVEGDRLDDYLARLKSLAVDTSVPVTFGMFSTRRAPDYWRNYFRLADETAAAGAGCSSRSTAVRSTFCSRSRPTCPSTSCRCGANYANGRSPNRRQRCAILKRGASWSPPRTNGSKAAQSDRKPATLTISGSSRSTAPLRHTVRSRKSRKLRAKTRWTS